MDNQQQLEQAIKNLGCEFTYDEDGDINFTNSFGTYVLTYEDNFLSLTYPNFYAAEGFSEKVNLLNIFDEINQAYKAVKFYFIDNNASASVEGFYEDESNFDFVIEFSLNALNVGLKQFSKRLKQVKQPEEN
ncbi:hypothetical protein QVK63_004368 [Vibrio vulnificus]|nr:hypothetical protein [Vibrio vulnificus]EKO5192485.1 hypothetical protein [Vibrio vulnificus]ELO5516976.1 hypothetical protein [Vibrio vulnificus]MCU8361117.1 hypothetical protein [Vibrio vulnificus]